MIIRYGLIGVFLAISNCLQGDFFSDIGQGLKRAGDEIEKGVKNIAKKTKDIALDVKEKGEEIIQKGIVNPLEESFQQLDEWVLPDSNKRFNEVTYLGAHNAHANIEDGFVYAQQQWNIEKQLEKGVRHFLLDVWPYKGKLLLCHGDCGQAGKVLTAGKSFKTFKSALETIKEFLDKNPKEIVSIELETYATAADMRKTIESVKGLSKYILTKSVYDPQQHNYQWPRLSELQKWNKRLIIFDDPKKNILGIDINTYGYYTSSYVQRNRFGTHIAIEACLPRDYKVSFMLSQLNYFGTVSSPLSVHNTPTVLKQLWENCRKEGTFDSKNPNFVVVDFVDRGNAMRWVNELNKQK